MVDIFEPVARVMTALQGLSVPVWKVETWSRGLVQWLRRAEEQCTTDGDFDYFPLMKKHVQVNYLNIVVKK